MWMWKTRFCFKKGTLTLQNVVVIHVKMCQMLSHEYVKNVLLIHYWFLIYAGGIAWLPWTWLILVTESSVTIFAEYRLIAIARYFVRNQLTAHWTERLWCCFMAKAQSKIDFDKQSIMIMNFCSISSIFNLSADEYMYVYVLRAG